RRCRVHRKPHFIGATTAAAATIGYPFIEPPCVRIPLPRANARPRKGTTSFRPRFFLSTLEPSCRAGEVSGFASATDVFRVSNFFAASRSQRALVIVLSTTTPFSTHSEHPRCDGQPSFVYLQPPVGENRAALYGERRYSLKEEYGITRSSPRSSEGGRVC